MKKSFLKIFLPLITALMISVLPACWPGKTKQVVEKQIGLVVINVLDKSLHKDCHIKGSRQVNLENVESYATERIDKNANVVFYCSNYMCSSSGFARKKLVDLGFKNVYVYEGGMAEWYQLGYPAQGPANSSYLKRKMKAPEIHEPYVLSAQELKEKIDMATTIRPKN